MVIHNSLTGTKNKFSNITEISTNNTNIVNPAQRAEYFNDYFVNIGPKLEAEISNEPMDQETYHYSNILPTIDSSFVFQYINVDDVKSSLMNLKTNKSTALDKIPAKILKLSADIISPSLTYILTGHSNQAFILMIGREHKLSQSLSPMIDENAKIIDQFRYFQLLIKFSRKRFFVNYIFTFPTIHYYQSFSPASARNTRHFQH